MTPNLPGTADLFRLTTLERREINLVAQAIHRREVIPDHAYRYRSSTEHLSEEQQAQALLRKGIGQLIREEGYKVGIPRSYTPPQPRKHAVAGAAIDHGRASYADALEACRLLHAGRISEAQQIAARALGHRAALRVATRQLDQQARRHTGRYFTGEIFSVREYLDHPSNRGKDRAFRQWYFRLVLVWREDAKRLIVANSEQLEQTTGIMAGEPAWTDLCRWIQDHSNPEGLPRRGRPVADDRQLIFRERPDGGTPNLRAFVLRDYPSLVTALNCLRRSMILGDETDTDPIPLPPERPRPGLHLPDLDDPATVSDNGTLLMDDQDALWGDDQAPVDHGDDLPVRRAARPGWDDPNDWG